MDRAKRIKKDESAFMKRAKRFYHWYSGEESWPDFLKLAWVKKLSKTHSWHRPDVGRQLDQKRKLHKEKVDAQKQLKEELNY